MEVGRGLNNGVVYWGGKVWKPLEWPVHQSKHVQVPGIFIVFCCGRAFLACPPRHWGHTSFHVPQWTHVQTNNASIFHHTAQAAIPLGSRLFLNPFSSRPSLMTYAKKKQNKNKWNWKAVNKQILCGGIVVITSDEVAFKTSWGQSMLIWQGAAEASS